MVKFKITKNGYDNIKSDLDNLVNNELPAILKAVSDARELGDLKENEEYASAKEKQKIIQFNISTLNSRLLDAEIIDTRLYTKEQKEIVNFGAKVKLLDLDTNKTLEYQLVSEFESNLDEGKIAVESLVGKMLLNKGKDDEVDIKTPKGLKAYKILNIEY
ncbi:MAG: transcription elongation factor GreA [Rickettsiales bacterium]|jgi:transcription elongation factor GreA|nr:transcription elongation factor GreA [Rickettsiales bacterium]